MKLGVTPWNFADRTARGLTEQARAAEALGYDSFWLPENHFNPGAIPDPLMLLAAVAAGTETIRLATTSYLLPLRNPLQAAEQVAVLDQLSNGRVILGIGRGYAPVMLKAFNVVPSEKRKLFEWSLQRMRDAWSGQPVLLDDDETTVVLDPLRMPEELAAGLDDSKKLSKPVRERMFDLVATHAIAGTGQASVAEIDALNILQATMLAMRRAVDGLPVRPDHAIVDGNRAPGLDIPTRTLVGGDALSLSIAAASIVAKVTRDRIMARLGAEFPGFGWSSNAGYGTKQHAAALEKHGATRHHRRSFAPVAKLLK